MQPVTRDDRLDLTVRLFQAGVSFCLLGLMASGQSTFAVTLCWISAFSAAAATISAARMPLFGGAS